MWQKAIGIHLSSSIFFFIMSLFQAGIEARRFASSSAYKETRGGGGGIHRGQRRGSRTVSQGF